MTQGELCDSLITFLRDEWHVEDIEGQSTAPRTSTLSIGAICTIAQGNEPVVHWQSRYAPNQSDPTEGDTGFETTTELGETVWIRDDRAEPVLFTVELATRIDKWIAKLSFYDSDIRTTTGRLTLDDESIRKAARFLIDLTRKLAVIPQ